MLQRWCPRLQELLQLHQRSSRQWAQLPMRLLVLALETGWDESSRWDGEQDMCIKIRA